jgi:thiol:disulfide interchange protein DsbD
MRAFAFLVILIPFLSIAQVSHPVQWKAIAKKTGNAQYQLQVEASIQQNWYVYAQENSELALEQPSIQFQAENIIANSQLQISVAPHLINDAVFNKRMPVFQDQVAFEQPITINNTIPATLKIIISAYTSNGKEFIPLSDTISVNLEGGVTTNAADQIILSNLDLKNPVANCGDRNQKDGRLLTTFLLGLLGGLVALLTPCVFPMVPVTVSFFTAKSKDKRDAVNNGLLYGSCIVIIYLLASIPFHLAGNINPQLLNTISTNAWVNIFFFIVFVFFALSFFGWFDITLPASLSNITGSNSKLTSIAGIFFMALTLAIVSFSCTGPILGTLLVGSLSANGAWRLTAGMAGFGVALGLPFALFAMFPQWLKRLPKSGSWMNVVKKSLAFVELALALKFLSNADLVEHWGILKREVFVGLWIIISLCLAFYLFGIFESNKQFYPSPVLRIETGKKVKHSISKARWFFGGLTLLFCLYLTPGVTQTSYANLKLLSGFPPPLSYSIYGKDNAKKKTVEPDVINDLNAAIQLAKQQHKPILIDFTGWGCVNCRKMEENVWTNPTIKELIQKKFILVSLYVDDRKRLPAGQQFTYKAAEGTEKEISTIGDKYAAIEATNFKQVTQPLYAIINSDTKLLNDPVGYTPSVSDYKEWLQCGSNAYRSNE